MKAWHWLAIGAALIFIGRQNKTVENVTDDLASEGAMAIGLIPRGIRNKNPGNIRHGEEWQGLAAVQPDASFATFTSMAYGIRAIAKLLETYRTRYGLNTVRGIITRWAPPNENNTAVYIADVAKELKVTPDQTLNFAVHLPGLIRAIIRKEVGSIAARLYVSDADITNGIRMAA